MVGAARELDYFSAHIHLRESGKSDDKTEGDQLPKSKASVRKDMDSKEYHSVIEVDLLITKKGMQMQGNV
ncbi:hypothetical protein B296_00027942 [Ensete ventricosum]|uniref:Uncharacterized protein n=1 Tax=Ensete ventricosum TaxID=4639 RepID=A0A426XSR3_ENSVE|nr:hypothetical protein B296_00027942 [Ensete ventricosum]